MFIKKSRYQPGFTIVELLVVIVVIGILAAITVVAFNGVTGRATEAAILSDLRNGATQIGIAQVDTGQYPANLDALELSTSAGNTYDYTGGGDEYCLTFANANAGLSYYTSSENPTFQAGLCPGHTLPSPPAFARFETVTTHESAGYNNARSFTHNGGTAPDGRYSIVAIATRADDVTSVTYGGSSMDEIARYIGNNATGITVYGLADPPLEDATVEATFSGYVLSSIAAMTFSDVDLGDPINAESSVLSGYSLTPSSEITTTIDKSLILSMISLQDDVSATPPGTTRVNFDHDNSSLGRFAIGEVEQESAGAVSLSWTINPIDNFTMLNLALKGN